MNGPPRLLERRRSNSKDPPSAKKSAAKKKSSPRNPLKEINGGSGVTAGGGSFKFSRSNSIVAEPPVRPKPLARTPQSAPLNHRRVASNPENPTNTSARRISQKVEPKTNAGVPSQSGSRKPLKTGSQDLLRRQNKTNPGSNGRYAVRKCDLEQVSEGKVGSCLASTPEKALLGFNTYNGLGAAQGGARKVATTPTSGATPPVQASISPEVPVEAFAAAATPIRFAAGHVIAGVHDRRKCKPRGLLAIGGIDVEIEGAHGVGADPTRVSGAPPPLAAADIHWMSSPSEKVNLGLGSSFDLCSEDSLPHCPADASVDWLLPLCKNRDETPKEESLLQTRTSLGHGFWDFSPSSSTMVESPKLRGLLSLNSPGSERTPSPQIGIQKTPTTGSSISPFSMILKGIAKSSKNKCVRPQPALEEGSSSTKKHSLAHFEMGKLTDVLEEVSLSASSVSDDTKFQSTASGLSFQFRSLSTASNSVDLNHFQNPSQSRISLTKNASPKEQTRISWREGLVSRIFDVGELDCSKWLTDDEDCSRSSAGIQFESESSSTNLKNQNEHLTATGFGSVEFVFETKDSEPKVPPEGPISCAESISTEGLVLDSSDDSDWRLFYKNNLFEV